MSLRKEHEIHPDCHHATDSHDLCTKAYQDMCNVRAMYLVFVHLLRSRSQMAALGVALKCSGAEGGLAAFWATGPDSFEVNEQASFGVNEQASFGVNERASFGVNEQASFEVNEQASFGVNERASFRNFVTGHMLASELIHGVVTNVHGFMLTSALM